MMALMTDRLQRSDSRGNAQGGLTWAPAWLLTCLMMLDSVYDIVCGDGVQGRSGSRSVIDKLLLDTILVSAEVCSCLSLCYAWAHEGGKFVLRR